MRILIVILVLVNSLSAFSKQPVYDDTEIKKALEEQMILINTQQEVINRLNEQISFQEKVIQENQIGIYSLYGATYETKIKI